MISLAASCRRFSRSACRISGEMLCPVISNGTIENFIEKRPFFTLFLFRNVGLNPHGLAALRRDRFDDLMRQLFVARVVDDDGRSVGSKSFADRSADTTRAAGNECRFSIKRKRHEFSLL